jgi:hypothetical protein
VVQSAAKADGGAPVVPEKIVPNVDQKLGVEVAGSGSKETQQTVKPVLPTPTVIASTAIGKATTVLSTPAILLNPASKSPTITTSPKGQSITRTVQSGVKKITTLK